MGFLESLQNSAFGMWVAGAPTIWAYPTILTLHAVGMGMAVGASAVLDLRLLGVAPQMPLAELEGTFRPMWIGFVINAASGVLLFIAAAADIGIKPVFYIKLSLILFALLTAGRIRRVVFGDRAAPDAPVPQQARILAATSLVLWTGAIVAGRLMAYIH
jgi:hypothetical protein